MRNHIFLGGLVVVLGLLLPQITNVARAEEKTEQPTALPLLVDLGAGKCIPCKKMAPIIEELKKDYAGIVNVVFVDVWKDSNAGKPYKIRVIPTQVFYDRAGKEVFRHEGFFSREDIEKVFREKMGVPPLTKPSKVEEKRSSELMTPVRGDEDPGSEAAALPAFNRRWQGPPSREEATAVALSKRAEESL
jgi:thiol-disulfide isomerase/thioredoxin